MTETTEPRTRLKTIVVFSLLLAILGAVVVFGYFATFARPVTTVILVRHAEKKVEPDNPDPDLMPEGETRAQEIARMLGNSGVNVIYASQYKRTQQTVKPLADRVGVAATILDARQTEELTRQIQTDHRGKTIFVAGHNNTVPALVTALSGDNYGVIPESEYDNMFFVTIYRFGKAKVVKLKYGNESTQGVGSGHGPGEVANEEARVKRKEEKTNKPAKSTNANTSESRRSFVKLLPALGAAGLAVTNLPLNTLAQTATPSPLPTPSPSPTPAPRITKEMLRVAEKLMGLEFTDAQEALAAGGVNRNLDSYETVRKIDVPLDTEPAIAFHPARARKELYAPRTKFRFSKVDLPAFKTVDDLAFATVPQLAELIRTRKVTSTELTKMYLGRLKRFGPKLFCIVTLTEELAVKQAAAADADIKRGKYRGPLHGIPWGAKDLFATKGIKTTWGAEPYRDQVIDYDATVIERLDAAGAVLVAKLSMGALAQGGRWFGGVTRNPWIPDDTTPGSSGSSAGPASATAAGLVGFSIGTETLGSIITPSSICGCTGLRPTYGRVSRFGAMGLSWTMDKVGPICRGVEDCAAALSAIYGPDGKDITVGDAPFNWNPDTNISTLRIGYLKTEFEGTGNQPTNEQQRQLQQQRRAVYKTALEALEKAGAKLTPLELPQFSAGSLRFILTAEAAAAFDDITRDGRVNQLSGQNQGDWPNSFRTSRFIPAVEYLRAQRARTLLMLEMEKLMSQWDVFVSPAPGSASLLITNLTGHPAVCLPCGFVNDRPISIMFTGGVYNEVALMRVAMAFERATKWHTMHPKMDFA